MLRRFLVALIWCATAWSHPLMRRFLTSVPTSDFGIAALFTLLIFVLALLGARLCEKPVRGASWPMAIVIGAAAGLAGVFLFFFLVFMISSLCSEQPGALAECVLDAVRWGWASVVAIIFMGAGVLNILAASAVSAGVLKYRRAPGAGEDDDVSSPEPQGHPAG